MKFSTKLNCFTKDFLTKKKASMYNPLFQHAARGSHKTVWIKYVTRIEGS